MQGITREMNFSETTFVLPSQLDGCSVKVRIFTPGTEIPFAGHPTLGTAYVLKQKGKINSNLISVTLELGIGPINADYLQENAVCMYQPKPTVLEDYTDLENMARILSLPPEAIDHSFPMSFVSTGSPYLIVPMKSLASLQKVRINTDVLIKTLTSFPCQEILAFSTETHHPDSSLHMRMFAPMFGVMEDPATGSAAGPMGAYTEMNSVLSDHSKGKTLTLEQGYEIHRPSKLLVNCQYTSDKISGVRVTGQVKTVAEGIFYL
ncbi:MAG: PhzF family phenazine biosynthesis protein [Candidatus Hodarchaeales archaeon]|jgi:trans-2,3-dihydro-3-hydroxyanthranilate isomerase